MFQLLFFTQLTTILLISFMIAIFLIMYDQKRQTKKNVVEDGFDTEPPSPRGFPVIGHLHLLGGYEIPYQAFSALGKRYGEVVKLKLGNVNCVVVNGQRNIRETLVTKGHHFDSRPNFERYQQLFCGNKENSLAFCNWSEMQKKRRDMLKAYTFPRAFTNKYASLESIVSNETDKMMDEIVPGRNTEMKPIILQHCANIFVQHFCSREFSKNDNQFVSMIEDFDEIFWEVNQGYAADFLPFLLPLHQKNLARMNTLAHNIRNFILSRVIGNRYDSYQGEEPADYVESLIEYVKGRLSPELSWDTALFALEDIIGGHSAVGNFLVKLVAFLVNKPEVQKRMQEDIDLVASSDGGGYRNITLSDRSRLPYIDGVIFEAIRMIASPIVPRVANQDSSINGYTIKKDTVIFLNNYDLSMSDQLWDEPAEFKPERFVQNGRLFKPEHFLPFGGGRRSCMGYKMVQLISFGILARLLQTYTIKPADNEAYKVPIGSLALPKKAFSFKFEKRHQK